MYLVKLDAINSTNTYLKELSKDMNTCNWTVVTAEYQFVGRGQMRTKWQSDKGKNLICSMLIKFDDLNIADQFYLNCAISLGIYKVLNSYKITHLTIKWPNDIMAGNKKLGGILIENSLINNKIHQTVVGIGLNVNQDEFIDELPNAISMKQIMKQEFDRDKILVQLVESIKEQILLLNKSKFDILHQNYEKVLYKKEIPHMFSNNVNQLFLGKIIGVSSQGKLIVELDDERVMQYDFKEVKFM